MVFKGEANDEEDGELSGNSLVWESNLDGQIGTGNEFNQEALSLGAPLKYVLKLNIQFYV